MRVVETSGSVWVFDMNNSVYIRLPKPGVIESRLEYTNTWERFEKLEPTNRNSIVVHRPVAWGTGALRETGTILHDTGDTRHA